MSEIVWFRAPSRDVGTLNACYNALDIQVVRGRADDVAWSGAEGDRTFAWLLAEVAAFAGVLRAFGVRVGDTVSLGRLPLAVSVVAGLAVARVGAISSYEEPLESACPSASPGSVRVAMDQGAVVVHADAEKLPWEVAMRAGRTDPAPCADVAGDAILARRGEFVLTVLDALGAADEATLETPSAAALVEIGGLTFWSFDVLEAEG